MHPVMADEVDGTENFVWDNQSWIFSDNNSGGDVGIDVVIGTIGDGDQDKGKKVLDIGTSNSQNILGVIGDMTLPADNTIRTKRRAEVGGGGGVSSSKKASGGESKVAGETHVLMERERRKKIRDMFSSLHSWIPNLPPKADKYTIVDEAVSYIKSLEQTLKKLQKQKLERLHGMSTMNSAHPSRNAQQKLGPVTETRESFMADKGSSGNLATMNAGNPYPSFSNIPQLPMSSMAFQTWLSPNVVLNVCGEEAQISMWSLKQPGVLSMICSILDEHKLEVVSAHVFADDFRSMYMIQMRGNSIDHHEGFLVVEAFKSAAAEIMRRITNS